MIRFYCDSCEVDRPVVIESLLKDDLNDDPAGDIICAEPGCHFVIATLSADVQGDVTMTLMPLVGAERVEVVANFSVPCPECGEYLQNHQDEVTFFCGVKDCKGYRRRFWRPKLELESAEWRWAEMAERSHSSGFVACHEALAEMAEAKVGS